MKKLAARDFEDMLQCSIPAFEDLLDGHHNKRVMKLLYRTAEWHGFAKLRMHTQATLDHLDSLTNEYGRLMRSFRDLTCSQFDTEELPREAEARKRAQQRAHARGSGTRTQAASTSQRKKTLNLLTPKFHALGDYVRTIQIFGTTDSFSTQVGELAHRTVKRLYGRTNKRDATKQIGQHVRRLERAELAADHPMTQMNQRCETASVNDNIDQDLEKHYQISKSRRDPVNLYSYVYENEGDPAFKDFIPKLKDHLLGRLLERDYEGDTYGNFTEDERNTIRISGDQIYQSRTMRINYTTYDIRNRTGCTTVLVCACDWDLSCLRLVNTSGG